jgi:hypothetical protein
MGDNNGQNPRDPRESMLWDTVGSQAGASLSSPAGGPGAGRFKQFAPQGTTTTAASVSAGDGFWDRFWHRLRDRLPHEATKAGVRVIVGPGLGILTDYFLDRYEKNANYVAEACRRALAKYVAAAIEEETGQAIEELVQGILQSLVMMMAVVATTTLIGAGAGAAVGFFCFGVGAAPGAAAGAELGFDAGLWILEWLGIGFLAVYIAKNLSQVVKVLGAGVVRAWNAGDHGASVDQDLDAAGKNIAKAIGILFRLILEAVVMYLLQEGIAAVSARVPGLVKSLSESKLGRGFGEWIGKNYRRLIDDPKVNPKLRESSGTGGTGGQAPDAHSPASVRDTSPEPVTPKEPPAGETTSTQVGKRVHKTQSDLRRASGEFDAVNSPITDKEGNPILVPKRVDLETGAPQPGAPLQEAIPDAVSYDRGLIIDDKPVGRPLAKDRQEIIRFIKAYEQREGVPPKVIAIQRYDPSTGAPVNTELYTPEDFLPGK